MSKSYKNYIGINEEPKEIFGKIMSISDELMENIFKPSTEIQWMSLKVTKIH